MACGCFPAVLYEANYHRVSRLNIVLAIDFHGVYALRCVHIICLQGARAGLRRFLRQRQRWMWTTLQAVLALDDEVLDFFLVDDI